MPLRRIERRRRSGRRSSRLNCLVLPARIEVDSLPCNVFGEFGVAMQTLYSTVLVLALRCVSEVRMSRRNGDIDILSHPGKFEAA